MVSGVPVSAMIRLNWNEGPSNSFSKPVGLPMMVPHWQWIGLKDFPSKLYLRFDGSGSPTKDSIVF